MHESVRVNLCFIWPYLSITFCSMAIALAWLAVWEIPETCLAFITTAAKCIISTVALAIVLTTEGVEGPLVVAVTSWKFLDILTKHFN